MRKSKTPLSGLRSGEDSLAGKRSHTFTRYLETLPADERNRILDAERTYVNAVQAATSTQQAAAKAFTEGMLGVKEDEPKPYRGFVI